MRISGLGTTSIRQQNVGFLKQYTPTLYKLTHMNSVRLPGFEERNKKPTKRCHTRNSEKLQNSLSRSRATVFELAICNPWQYFATLTLDPTKNDRYDLTGSYRRLAKWFNNYNSRNGSGLQYLLVPEPHRDGAWHFHGLFLGLPSSHLQKFTLDDHITTRMKEMIATGHELFNWPAYRSSFGFVALERIRNPEHCAAYMSKYITKELQTSSIEKEHHLYYCSQNLKRAELLHRGQIMREIEDPDFENDYVRIKRFFTAEDALSYFCEKEVT